MSSYNIKVLNYLLFHLKANIANEQIGHLVVCNPNVKICIVVFFRNA